MNEMAKDFSQYIEEALGIHVFPDEWSDVRVFPLYIRQRYRLFKVILQGVSCVLVVNNGDEPTPEMIEKHLKQVFGKTALQTIFVNNAIKSYDRKRLIQRKIPFVIPGNQLYLPFLGMDLRERMINQQKNATQLTASAQYLFLYMIMQQQNFEITPSVAAEMLEYSKMTMSRAFQELESAGIGIQKRNGKTKVLQLGETKQNIWKQALPYLKSPVQKIIFIMRTDNDLSNEEHFVLAGDSAISEISEIAEPRIAVYAVHSKAWDTIKENYQEIPYPEADAIQIELWTHPVLKSHTGSWVYEPLLYLTMINEQDDRLQAALMKMMEDYTW